MKKNTRKFFEHMRSEGRYLRNWKEKARKKKNTFLSWYKNCHFDSLVSGKMHSLKLQWWQYQVAYENSVIKKRQI